LPLDAALHVAQRGDDLAGRLLQGPGFFLHRFGDILQVVRVAELVRRVQKDFRDRGHEAAFLVRDDAENRDAEVSGQVPAALQHRDQVIGGARQATLRVQDFSAEHVPLNVQDRRTIVVLDAVDRQHDAALLGQPRPQPMGVSRDTFAESHVVVDEVPDGAGAHRQPVLIP
jgi:hypothetical protein